MGIINFITNALSDGSSSQQEMTNTLRNYQQVNQLTATLASISKGALANSESTIYGRMAPVGLDAVIQDWVRQQFIYRRTILQDLYVMAFQTTELASALGAIKREAFRKGLSHWKQRFARKCIECGKEFPEHVDKECDTCYQYEIDTEWRYDEQSGRRVPVQVKKWIRDERGKKIPSSTRTPDPTQQQFLEKFIGDANSFHQPLLAVLQEFFEDILIADDGFLLINKEYLADQKTGEITSQRVFEITRLHPALVEFDIDRKDGIPERSHFICLLHGYQVHTSPGKCNVNLPDGGVCGIALEPAMYRYYQRGRYRYYTRDAVFHVSFAHPSKSYGYSHDLLTSVLTNRGFLSYNELKSDDKIATVNLSTGQLEYSPYEYKWQYHYKGRAYREMGQYIDQLTTANHHLIAKLDDDTMFHHIPAETLNGRPHSYLSTIRWVGEEQKYFTLPAVEYTFDAPVPKKSSFSMPIDVWAEFMGVYIARGSFSGKQTVISYNKNNKNRIWESLKKTGLNWNAHPDDRGFYINHSALVHFFADNNKEHLIDKFLKYPNSIREIFSRTAIYHMTDGHNVRVLPSIKFKDQLYGMLDSDISPIDDSSIFEYSHHATRTNIYPELQIPMDDWLRFLGWYLSEGSHSGQTIHIPQIETAKNRIDLEKACDALPFGVWGKNKDEVYKSSRQLTSYLTQFGKSYEKFIPDYVFNLSPRQIRLFFDSIMMGDGYGNHYYSTSKKLAEGMVDLGLKLGYSISIREKINRNNSYRHIYHVGFLDGTNAHMSYKTKSCWEDYDGMMWCLSVPPNKTMVVKRNGKVSVTGNSNVLTIFQKILTMHGLDSFFYRYFYERKIPPGLIITYTDDPDSLETEIERARVRMLEDPNTVPWIAASARTQRGRTDHIKLNWHFDEMDTLAVRQEIRERIAMLWGVTPMYQGDTASVGGLTRETAQTSMFENLIESYQNTINKGVIPFLLEQLGITDWTIELIPPREKTEQEKLELERLRIDNATAMKNIGYNPIKTKGTEIFFTYEKMSPLALGLGGEQPGAMQPGGEPGAQLGLPPPPPEEELEDGEDEALMSVPKNEEKGNE